MSRGAHTRLAVRALVVCVVALLASGPAYAARVVLLADADAKPTRDAEAALRADGHTVELLVLATARDRVANPDANPDANPGFVTWLAAGPESALALAASPHTHRAALLVRSVDAPRGIVTVPLDVDLPTQMTWLSRAFPGRTRVLVLRDPGAHSLDDVAAQKAALAAGLTLVLVDVRAQGETVPALATALRAPGPPPIVWVVPDKTAITADTLAPLTQAALSARVPLVGFSPYFLRVGALGAIVADAGDSARQAFALAQVSAAGDAALVQPAAARLVVDGRLAQRLGIPVKAGVGVEVRK